jgi:DNA-binding IscR family transcriptional regulator
MSVETDAVLSSLWDELRTTMQAHLSAVTLRDLAQRSQLRTGELMYEI